MLFLYEKQHLVLCIDKKYHIRWLMDPVVNEMFQCSRFIIKFFIVMLLGFVCTVCSISSLYNLMRSSYVRLVIIWLDSHVLSLLLFATALGESGETWSSFSNVNLVCTEVMTLDSLSFVWLNNRIHHFFLYVIRQSINAPINIDNTKKISINVISIKSAV